MFLHSSHRYVDDHCWKSFWTVWGKSTNAAGHGTHSCQARLNSLCSPDIHWPSLAHGKLRKQLVSFDALETNSKNLLKLQWPPLSDSICLKSFSKCLAKLATLAAKRGQSGWVFHIWGLEWWSAGLTGAESKSQWGRCSSVLHPPRTLVRCFVSHFVSLHIYLPRFLWYLYVWHNVARWPVEVTDVTRSHCAAEGKVSKFDIDPGSTMINDVWPPEMVWAWLQHITTYCNSLWSPRRSSISGRGALPLTAGTPEELRLPALVARSASAKMLTRWDSTI